MRLHNANVKTAPIARETCQIARTVETEWQLVRAHTRQHPVARHGSDTNYHDRMSPERVLVVDLRARCVTRVNNVRCVGSAIKNTWLYHATRAVHKWHSRCRERSHTHSAYCHCVSQPQTRYASTSLACVEQCASSLWKNKRDEPRHCRCAT